MYIREFPDEVMGWASTKVLRLSHLKGFPTEPAGVNAVVRAILRIAHPGLVRVRLWKPSADLGGVAAMAATELGAVQAALRMTPGELETVTISHSRFGNVKPLEWLCDEALERNRFFPAIPELRELFCTYWPAADGAESQGVLTESPKEPSDG